MCFCFDRNLDVGRLCLREVFQTLCVYNVTQGLGIHSRIDDLDLILRS